MSLLARLRAPQARLAIPPHLRPHTSVVRSFSLEAAQSPEGSSRAQHSEESQSVTRDLFNVAGALPARMFEDLPPAAPATGYPKPNPAKQKLDKSVPAASNPLREALPPAQSTLYRMYVKATRNNIIITFTRPNGDPLKTHTGGSCGFKHVNRSTHEAAHQCMVRMLQTIQGGILEKEPKMQLHLFLNGFGKGREAVKEALLGTEGDLIRPLVAKITDKTPIKIGGDRAKKRRRI